MRTARDLAEKIRIALGEDRRADAIKPFLADSGMPPEMIEGMSTDPGMQAVAPTMPYDFEIMGDSDGSTIPEDLVRSIGIPTLVIAGGASEDFFRNTAARIIEIIPDGQHVMLDGQDHSAPAAAVERWSLTCSLHRPWMLDRVAQHRRVSGAGLGRTTCTASITSA